MGAPERKLTRVPAQQVRCAIYTRKSTEEGLQQSFNTLDAQRLCCENYIIGQEGLGWSASSERYDDGGYTGANLERPAMRRLIHDIENGEISCVVVYRVDRLTRSTRDLAALVELFEKHKVTLVSVTEPINTVTSSGRMSLNLHLSFAQYEREVIAERTRDKMRAARRKGRWIGGMVPLGYDVAPRGGSIVVNPEEAERVRHIFELYLELGSLIPVVQELDGRGWRMKQWTTQEGKLRGGARFTKTSLYNLLTNALYAGRVRFEGELLPGEHEPIVTDKIWNAVQERLSRNGKQAERSVRNAGNALLQRMVRCGCGEAMIHTYTNKGSKRYRYYVCRAAHQMGWNRCPTRSVSAPELEGAVVAHLRGCGQHPGVLAAAMRAADDTDRGELQAMLKEFDELWSRLTTWEQEQFVRELVSQVEYDGPSNRVTVTFRSDAAKAVCIGG